MSDALVLKLYLNIGEKKNNSEEDYAKTTYADFVISHQSYSESHKQRLEYLCAIKDDLVKDVILRNIICNDKIFRGCVRSLPLYSSGGTDSVQRIAFDYGMRLIEKDNRDIKRLALIKLIEDYLKIGRFQVSKIEISVDDIPKFVAMLKEHNDLLPSIVHSGTTNSAEIKKRIDIKLNNITAIDKAQKFMADIYNLFDDIIVNDCVITRPVINKRKLYITTYANFHINNDTKNYHKKFIDKLTCEYEFI